MPTNYTKKRRIGSVMTDGSGHILVFSQNGDEFLWDTSFADVDVTNLGTSAVLYGLTVPTGVKVNAIISVNTAGSNTIFLSSPDQSDQAASMTILTTQGIAVASMGNLRTNTNAQIRARAQAASTYLLIDTNGWIDTRGRFN
jgi:hypothetical protein